MWGLFSGEARKQPPPIPFSTAIPKDPDMPGSVVLFVVYNLIDPR